MASSQRKLPSEIARVLSNQPIGRPLQSFHINALYQVLEPILIVYCYLGVNGLFFLQRKDGKAFTVPYFTFRCTAANN